MGKIFLYTVFVALAIAITWGFSTVNLNDDPNGKDLRLYKSKLKNNQSINFNKDNPDIDNNGNQSPQSVLSESFEGGTFPPPGWIRVNIDNGSGWSQQSNGTSPVPGFLSGTVTVPPGGGSKCAFATWIYSGSNFSDQYLITPQITNVQSNDSLKFWMRYWPNSYRDSIQVRISTTTNTPAAFTTLVFAKNFPVGTSDTAWSEYKFKIGGLVSAGSNIYIAFREVVPDNFLEESSISLDLVSVTMTTVFTNDIATSGNLNPASNLFLPVTTIAPKAIFNNVGSANQTSIPITYKITGPVNYTSNKVISSLNSSGSTIITFDSTFNPTAGTYNATIYCGLASDQNRTNDTIKTTFTVSNPNFGSGGTYFYSNSTSLASGAPSQPQACFLDTSNCTYLVKNGIDQTGAGVLTGTLDDGYWNLKLPSNLKIRFFGKNYDSVKVGTNGIIAFQNYAPNANSNWNPPISGIPGGSVLKAIYPLWMDMRFDTQDNPVNYIKYKVVQASATTAGFYIFYSGPRYGVAGDVVKYSIYIETATSPVTNSRTVIEYPGATEGQGAGFISSYNNNTLQTHLVGLQDSLGVNALQYRFRNTSTVISAGPLFNGTSGMLAMELGPNSSQLDYKCQTLTLNSRLEAIQLNRRDTLTVNIRALTSPFNLIESKKAVYDSLTGISSVPFSLAANGGTYYLQVIHRNSIPTWSAVLVNCSGYAMNYNFTTNICQAFGCNQILVNADNNNLVNVASFFTGDVSGDYCIDASDIVAVYNDVTLVVGGPYVITDLNFDEIVDVTDLLYTYNNSVGVVCEVTP